jgi:hypothetical protein
MNNKLRAVDVLDWEYLCSIANEHADLVWTTDIRTAVERFAFDFTQAADDDDRDEILTRLLQLMTFGHSAETNEGTIAQFARFLCADVGLVRAYGKQQGIRLTRR